MQAAREAHKLLEETELHMKEKMAIQLGLQKHREVAEVAEVATHERIRQLQMRRIREDVSGVELDSYHYLMGAHSSSCSLVPQYCHSPFIVCAYAIALC